MAGQINRNMEESRIESTKARLQRSAHVFLLGGIPAKTFFSRLWSATNQDQIIDRAAELAYYFLFGLFPALILMSAMFGVFTHVRGPANLELMLYLARVIPPSAFAIVQSAFTQTTKSSDTGHLAFGALAALWAATYGMSSAQTVLNVIYRARESRPYWKAKAIAAGLTVAIFVLVVSAMLLLVLGDFLAKLLISDLLFNPFVHIVWKAIQLVASLFLCRRCLPLRTIGALIAGNIGGAGFPPEQWWEFSAGWRLPSDCGYICIFTILMPPCTGR